MARIPRSDWTALTVRLTAFPVVPIPVPSDLAPWIQGLDFEPESTLGKKAEITTTGSFADGKLSLQVQPSRVDWLLQPRDIDLQELVSDPTMPAVGPIDSTLELFASLIRKWLGSASVPELSRLAFGLVVQHPVENRQAGYRQLEDYVPVQIDPDNSSDFIYQINRPRQSRTLPDVAVNRLSKWTVVHLHLAMAFQIDPALLGADPQTRMTLTSLRIELDINTPLLRQRLPADRLVSLFDEFVGLASEIVADGDVVG